MTEVRGKCELFETITVKVENLQEFLKQADNRLTDIILYLDGYPLSGIHPRRDSVSGNELLFDLIMIEDIETAQTEKSWNSLLGKPKLLPPVPRKVSVTVGIVGGLPIDTAIRDAHAYDLVIIHKAGFYIFLGILVIAIALFGLQKRVTYLETPVSNLMVKTIMVDLITKLLALVAHRWRSGSF